MVETPAVLFNASPALPPPTPAVDRSRRYTRILLMLFLCTLPLVNPIVHGDGFGYCAYVCAPLSAGSAGRRIGLLYYNGRTRSVGTGEPLGGAKCTRSH